MADSPKQPLLSPSDHDDETIQRHSSQSYFFAQSLSNHSFVADEDDIELITGVDSFLKTFVVESKKLWYLAAPAMLTSVCQYSLGAITQTLAGHIGTLELAAFSIENTVISNLCFGFMWGMGSALETLCGQAYGAGQVDMLGVYMQRSWVILLGSSFVLTLLYVFAEPILLLLAQDKDISHWGMGSALETLCGQAYGAGQVDMLGVYMQRSWVILLGSSFVLTLLYVFAEPILLLLAQDKDISHVAARYSLWMIPQLFAYAMNFPISKFLQAQSKMMAMAWISVAALVLHVFFSWLFMLKLGWGMGGGALVLNLSWWFIVVAQLVYIFMGSCGRAWSGFTWKAFHSLGSFLKLSLASAVMLCLEMWYYTALVLFAGYLKHAEVAVDALSICLNILGWTIMVSLGLNAAVSVRVSNELGAAHPRTAKLSMVVVVITAFLISLLFSALILIFQNQYPYVFTESLAVRDVVYELTPLLAFCVIISNVQPALSGVAIGAGWQALVAYVNIGCYYVFGIPLGLVMGYALNMGVKGIWLGMITGTVVQTLGLFWMVYVTNWNKEASIAVDRVRKWGGESETKPIHKLKK